MDVHTKISALKGIGEKTEKIFQKAGIYTVGDLIQYFPRGYDVYEEPVAISELEEGRTMTVTGAIYGRVQVGGNPKMQITTLYLKDITGTLKVVWFRMPFLRSTLSKGGVITLRGRIIRKKDGLVLEHPEIFYPSSRYAEKQDSLQPIYPLTAGMTNSAVIKAVHQVLDTADAGDGVLPEELEERYRLISYPQAIRGIHFPEKKEEFYRARERLVFEEFLVFILSIRMMKGNDRMLNQYCFREQPEMDSFLQHLPFDLTNAQKRTWRDIRHDMTGVHVMSRLVQGDVGSGKTIVALIAMIFAGLNGYQAAMMAPTEVLARQHYENIRTMLETYHVPLTAEILTGSMSAGQKRAAYGRIASGEVQIVVGTHALIQEKAVYKNLALVVTDEQHRFGVRQRENLAEKGQHPHILVMSATPIPRTLAIILYGDLDISVMDELPKNRLPIKNCVVDTGYRNTAYQFMKKQIQEGRQCYVICPMIEESESLEAENVTGYTESLREVMGEGIEVCCLHGKMKQSQKDEIMDAFSKNEIQILVSTTVIEVGIDVPNSTVMLIENAERFGLAQLHQLRRPRGTREISVLLYLYECIKIKGDERTSGHSESFQRRLFHCGGRFAAEGPGDLFGIRQSGLLDFRLGDVFQDSKILQCAGEAAGKLLEDDPGLAKDVHQPLKHALDRMISEVMLEKTL